MIAQSMFDGSMAAHLLQKSAAVFSRLTEVSCWGLSCMGKEGGWIILECDDQIMLYTYRDIHRHRCLSIT